MGHCHPLRWLHAALSIAQTSTQDSDVNLTSGDEQNRHFIAKLSICFGISYYTHLFRLPPSQTPRACKSWAA
ncbi:hypothetical protein EDB86DRAFT_2986128 [Lactarius hatsudake]|nr:hypothetical protein EDB86DRAFT_2986128 [Lactarius hatsudake]